MTAVPTFSDVVQSSHRMGFEESIVLNGVVSGLWTSFYSIGDAVGPSIGGEKRTLEILRLYCLLKSNPAG